MLFVGVVIAVVLLLVWPGCGPTAEQEMYAEREREIHLVEGKDFSITTIDGCQYILVPVSSTTFTLTHKGNCRNHSTSTYIR